MVSIEDEFEKEFEKKLARLIREKGLKLTKEMIVSIYHVKCRRGFLWYTFADIDYGLSNRMKISIMRNAPENKIQALKEIIEKMENKFNICFSICQNTSDKMYASFFGNLASTTPLLIMLLPALVLFLVVVLPLF